MEAKKKTDGIADKSILRGVSLLRTGSGILRNINSEVMTKFITLNAGTI